MCLGIPGLIVAISPDDPHLAKVDVSGVRRTINIGLVADEPVAPGDWVLIHVGFAMARIDEDEARTALAGLHLLRGTPGGEELDAFIDSTGGEP